MPDRTSTRHTPRMWLTNTAACVLFVLALFWLVVMAEPDGLAGGLILEAFTVWALIGVIRHRRRLKASANVVDRTSPVMWCGQNARHRTTLDRRLQTSAERRIWRAPEPALGGTLVSAG